MKVEQVFLAQENLVKCGAVVAPVTDWLLYDTIYTERFMAKYSYSKVDRCRQFNSGQKITGKVIWQHL